MLSDPCLALRVGLVDNARRLFRVNAVALHRASDERFARRVELFDRERAFGCTGDTSTTDWLRNNCNLSGFSADRHLKFARQLPALEATQKALDSGEIGIEHALELLLMED